MKTTAVLIGMLWLVAGVLRVEAQITDTFSFLNLNKPIPDGNSTGLSEVRTVASAITNLSSVRVKLRVAGEFDGDLYGYVRHIQNGAINWCVLLNRVGRTASNSAGYADAGLDVVLDDASTLGEIHTYGSNPPAGMPLTGTWQPDGRAVDPEVVLDSTDRTTTLSSFNSVEASGEWTLYLADLASGGTNLLVSWELEVSGMATPLVTWQRQYFTQAELTNSALEATYWGDLADPDGDGFSNGQEMMMGTSPVSSADALRAGVADQTNGDMAISFPTVLGKLYQVQRNENFPTGPWNSVGDNVVGTGAAMQIIDDVANALLKGVYRVVVAPQP